MRTLVSGLSLILTVAAFELFFAVHTIPVATGDALYFYTPALYLQHLDQLINPVLNVQGEHRFIWHGWLYPVLLAHLSPKANLSGLMIAEDLFATVTLILLLLCLLRTRIRHPALVLIFLLGTTTLIFANNGRPEMLVVLLLCVWQLLRTSPWFTAFWIKLIDGIALGTLFVANPYAALVIGAMYSCYQLTRVNSLKAIGNSLSAALLALIASGVLTSIFYPYSYGEWIRGLIQNLTVVVHWKPINESFYRYYIANPQYPLLLIWLTVLFFAIVLFCYQQRRKPVAFLISTPLLLFLFWFTFFRIPERNYYMVVFAPLCMLFLCYEQQNLSVWPKRLFISALIVASLSVSSGLLRRNMKNTLSYIYGASYESASTSIISLYEKHGRRLGVSGHFITVLFGSDPTPQRLRALIKDIPHLTRPEPSHHYYVMGQTSSGKESPPQLKEYDLIIDHFYRGPNKVLGTKIFRTPDAYNYAAWQREASLP